MKIPIIIKFIKEVLIIDDLKLNFFININYITLELFNILLFNYKINISIYNIEIEAEKKNHHRKGKRTKTTLQ